MKRHLSSDTEGQSVHKKLDQQASPESMKQTETESCLPTKDPLHESTTKTVTETSGEQDGDYLDDDEYSYASSNEEYGVTAKGGLPPNDAVEISQGTYRFCSTQEARQLLESSVKEVSDVLNIPVEAAVVILRAHNWDEKKLTDKYFSGSKQQQEILAECGVLHRCSSTNKSGALKSTGCCAICFEEDLNADDMFSMKCGHEFCRECWNGFIDEAMSRGPQCVLMQCPQSKCREVVTNREIHILAPDTLAKFEEFQLRANIGSNWKMRWCPGPSCDWVAVGSSADGLVGEGQCECGTRFCLRCGEMQHEPATCDMLVLWNEKCQDESETANWILAKTKKCPKCQARIEKNGGCNHMLCHQCRHRFCWLCMNDWSVHGYERSCNAFELGKAKEEDSARASAERELERYLHCFKRFKNHSQGLEFAEGELEKFEKTEDEKEKSDFSFDWNALKDALRQLIECRRVLKYTYVVTYCLKDRPLERELFEDHQGVLERFTEMLSEITEKDTNAIDRSELVNLTRAVERYTKGVMDCEIDVAI